MLRFKTFKFFLLLYMLLFSIIIKAQSPAAKLANTYFHKSDFEKAEQYFKKVSKKEADIPHIYENYRSTLLELKKYSQLTSYLNFLKKKYPESIAYKADWAVHYKTLGKTNSFEKEVDKLIQKVKEDKYYTEVLAKHFLQRKMIDQAITTYQVSRKHFKKSDVYSQQLASIYLLLGKQSEMIDEYLLYAKSNPSALEQTQNTLQTELSEEEDFELLIDKLYQKVNQDNSPVYVELLVWAYIQEKDFYNAFIQERSIDKKQSLGGDRLIDLGVICTKNRDYKTAVKIYEYVCEAYPNHPEFIYRKKLLINSKEDIAKNEYPIDTTVIISVMDDYNQLLTRARRNNEKADINKHLALLHAFYLDEKEKAIEILESTIALSRVNINTLNECKIALGDIYLLDEDARSSLLYHQVERSVKDSRVAHEAKLRNAKYYYYKGDFELAKSQLEVLKLATSREIANDAIDLSVFIQDNLALDTSDMALRKFSKAELLQFQNRDMEALTQLEDLLKQFPYHSLEDDIYWKKAALYHRIGDFEKQREQYQLIIDRHGTDILADDAVYELARLYEEKLGDKKKAMDLYKKILIDYRNSIYTAEARKRFRKLRGDTVN